MSESLAVAQEPLQTRAAGSGQLQIDSGLLTTPQVSPQSHPRPLTALHLDLLRNGCSQHAACVFMQVTCEFVPILREGWLQYRREPRSMMKGWKVGWFELLADGKLSWFPSPSKQSHESRCITAASCLSTCLSVCLCTHIYTYICVYVYISGWLAGRDLHALM